MLAQVMGAPSSSLGPDLGELGPGIAGSTVAVLLLLVATLLALRVVYQSVGARRARVQSGGPLAVIAQVELSASQSLYLVRAAGRCLLVGGTSGGLGLIAELDPAQVAAAATAAGENAEALSRAGAGTVAQRLGTYLLGKVP